MNPNVWRNVIMLAVGAPWLYRESEKEKNPYFSLGLKVAAGAVLAYTIPRLLADARPIIEAAAKLHAEQQNRLNTGDAVEAEFVEAGATNV